MTERIWHKGPPPHVGWWNASVGEGIFSWRWWDGARWSDYVLPESPMSVVATSAAETALNPQYTARIQWTDYWPENARVPRVDPARMTPAQIEAFNRGEQKVCILDELAKIPKRYVSDAELHKLFAALLMDLARHPNPVVMSALYASGAYAELCKNTTFQEQLTGRALEHASKLRDSLNAAYVQTLKDAKDPIDRAHLAKLVAQAKDLLEQIEQRL